MCSHYLRRDLITSPLMQKKPVLLQKQDIYCGYVLQLLRSSGNYLYFILIHSYNFILAPAKFIFRLHNYSSALISSFYTLRIYSFALLISFFTLLTLFFTLLNFSVTLLNFSVTLLNFSVTLLNFPITPLNFSITLLNFSGTLC